MKKTENQGPVKMLSGMESAFDDPVQCRGFIPPPLQLSNSDTADPSEDSQLATCLNMIDNEFLEGLGEEIMSDPDFGESGLAQKEPIIPDEKLHYMGKGMVQDDLPPHLMHFPYHQLQTFLTYGDYDTEFWEILAEDPSVRKAIFNVPEGNDLSSGAEADLEGPVTQNKAAPIQMTGGMFGRTSSRWAPFIHNPMSTQQLQQFLSSFTKSGGSAAYHEEMNPPHAAFDSATSVKVYAGPNSEQVGSSPSVKPEWWKLTQSSPKLKQFFSKQMVQAHMWNDNLGGTGKSMANLVTTTKSFNSVHLKQIEAHLKTALKNGQYVAYLAVPDYSKHPKPSRLVGKEFYGSLNAAERGKLQAICNRLPHKVDIQWSVRHSNGRPVAGKSGIDSIYNEDASFTEPE